MINGNLEYNNSYKPIFIVLLMVREVDDSKRLQRRKEHVDVMKGLAKEVFGEGVVVSLSANFSVYAPGDSSYSVYVAYNDLLGECRVDVKNPKFYDKAYRFAELCEYRLEGLEATVVKEFSSD